MNLNEALVNYLDKPDDKNSFELGLMYFTGNGGITNHQKARSLFQKSNQENIDSNL